MTKAERKVAMDGYQVLHSMLKGEYTEESTGARTIKQSGGKDRHSKVFTSRGARDRRVRLSVATAIRFYDLQDRLGFDQPSKAVEWLLLHSQLAIQTLPQLGLHHLHPHTPPPNPPPNHLHPHTPPTNPPLSHALITNPFPNHSPLHHEINAYNIIKHLDYNIITNHPTHAQDCEDPHTHHHHHPIITHTSFPNPSPNPPQTSLDEDPQYSNYSSASSDARVSCSPPNPAFQHKRKITQSPTTTTTTHHQCPISDLQDDYACSSNFTSQPCLIPPERLTIFNEGPMNYCSTNDYHDNNIPSDNWLPTQDQLNAHTHLNQFPNNAMQLYKPSFANHRDNTRLVPNLAGHLINQHVTHSLAQSCDMLAPQQLDGLDYEIPSPSESTSMKASKGIQTSNSPSYGQPASSNMVEGNAFSSSLNGVLYKSWTSNGVHH